jgi:hypothetical protein
LADGKIWADDGTEFDLFGYSVSLDGDTALVGAIWDDDLGDRSGAAYVFRLDEGNWTQVSKLLPDDGLADDEFGLSVSLSGGTALVGAYHNDASGSDSGAAYVFREVKGVWTQIAKLVPDDGRPSHFFGESVSLSGDTAVVGAVGDRDRGLGAGAAYVFREIAGVWTQIDKLTAEDGDIFDLFGHGVAVSGNTALIGSRFDDDRGDASGSAYVFREQGNDWVQIDKLTASNGSMDDQFGYYLALDGPLAVIGVQYDGYHGYQSGSAYIFEEIDGKWEEVDQIAADDGAERDEFGRSVAVEGRTVLVGAYNSDAAGADSGAAYVFQEIAGVWRQTRKVTAVDGQPGDQFGVSVSLSGGRALIGAILDDDNGTDAGAAYVIDDVSGGGCTRDPDWVCDGDVDGNGAVNPVDVGLVQAAFCAPEDCTDVDLCQYDLDCNGAINPVDAGLVQSLFGACDPPRDVCP